MSYKQNQKEYITPPSPYHPSPWVNILKVLYEVAFCAIILIGFVFCIKFSTEDEFVTGLIIFVLSVIIATLTVGFAIVFLELADDIRNMLNYVYQIENMLEDDKKRNGNVSGDIENTAENIYQIKTILENNTAKKE